jgi:hypothetical protein
MTPEQRVERVGSHNGIMMDETQKAIVAAAIRAAENNALNAAAAKILAAAQAEPTRERDHWYALLVESVLALKQ